jgi:uracil-DNA glycosylase
LGEFCGDDIRGIGSDCLGNLKLTLLIGQYAQRHFLGPRAAAGVGATVADHARFAPRYVPLPHPSPRNIAWFQRNPWFEDTLLPVLRSRVRAMFENHAGTSR